MVSPEEFLRWDLLAVDGVQTKVDCTSSYWVVLPVSQALVPCYQASVI
jgi:hypothetical protein